MAFATIATAQTTIVHFTGSTAFRAETHQAIIRSLGGTASKFAFSGATLNKASQAIFYGTVAGVPGQVIVETSWSGSVAGLIDLVTPTAISTFLSNTTYSSQALPATATGSTFGGGFSIPGTPTFESPTSPDVSMADNFAFESPNGTGGKLTAAQVALLSQFQVGVVPFVWERNNGAPTTIANMTNQLAQAFLALGSLPQSMFTGVATDTTIVYAVGRDLFSGTRVITFSETGFGVLNTPDQNEPTINGSNQVTAIVDVGSTGYSGGGAVATALSATGSNGPSNTTNPGWMVGYLAVSDATTVTGGGMLTYNGVPFSAVNIQQGTYTFWGYEHLSYLKTIAANPKTCLLYTSPSPRDLSTSRMPSSA